MSRLGYPLSEPIYSEEVKIQGVSRTIYGIGDHETGTLCCFGHEMRMEDFAVLAQIGGAKIVFVGARLAKGMNDDVIRAVFKAFRSESELLAL